MVFWVWIVLQVKVDIHLVSRGGYWQWAIGGLGSGSGVQFCGNWLKDILFGLFHCFCFTALLSYKGKDFFFLLP